MNDDLSQFDFLSPNYKGTGLPTPAGDVAISDATFVDPSNIGPQRDQPQAGIISAVTTAVKGAIQAVKNGVMSAWDYLGTAFSWAKWGLLGVVGFIVAVFMFKTYKLVF